MTTEPLRKITIRLTEEQLRKLRVLYPTLGYNAVIRKLVENHLEKRMESLTSNLEEPDE